MTVPPGRGAGDAAKSPHPPGVAGLPARVAPGYKLDVGRIVGTPEGSFMTRASWAKAVIVVAAALVVTTMAFADQSWDRPSKPGAGLREIYDRSVIWGGLEGSPVQLPRPVGDFQATQAAVSGPVTATPESPEVGSAIAQIRGGGSMYSEKELADREIGRLIRKLD